MKAVSVVVLVILLLVGSTVMFPRLIYGTPHENWLTFSLCRLPCWRGVTPGKTAYQSAIWHMERMPDVTFVMNLTSRLPQVPRRLIRAPIEQSRPRDLAQSTVQTLYFADLDMTLAELFNQLGDPSRQNVMYDAHGGALITLQYERDGVVALAGVSRSSVSRLCLGGFLLMSIDAISIHSLGDQSWPGVPWQGISDLSDALCREIQ